MPVKMFIRFIGPGTQIMDGQIMDGQIMDGKIKRVAPLPSLRS